jgi:hypothetical protein
MAADPNYENPYGPMGHLNDSNRQLSVEEERELQSNRLSEEELKGMIDIIMRIDFNRNTAQSLFHRLLPNTVNRFPGFSNYPVIIPLHQVYNEDTEATRWSWEKGSYQAKLLTCIEYIRMSRSHSGKRDSRKGKRHLRKGKRHLRRARRHSRKVKFEMT